MDPEKEAIEVVEVLKAQNVQLKELLLYHTNENSKYKSLYENLKQRLNEVNELLKINEQIFSNLLEDTREILQSETCTASSPLLQSKRKEFILSASLDLSLSKKLPSRPKIHIEPMSLEDFDKSLDEQECTLTKSQRSRKLSVILEESYPDAQNITYILKDVYVRLTRLPNEIVEKHLRKIHEDLFHISSDFNTTFSTNLEPALTSTPTQIDIKKKCTSGFVTTRRKKSSIAKRTAERNESPTQREKLLAPLKENNLTNNICETSNNSNSSLYKQPLTLRSPKTRRAKPQNLKEPTLKKKMRRK